MGGKSVRAIFVVAIILVSLLGGQSLSIKKCFNECNAQCRDHNIPSWWCKYMCALYCIRPPAAKVDSGCSFACAKSSCGQLDPGEIKIILSVILPLVVLFFIYFFIKHRLCYQYV